MIKILELVDKRWKEIPSLDFGLLVVDKDFVSKEVCFTPDNCDIIGLEAKVDFSGKDFEFKKSDRHLHNEWKIIKPDRIDDGGKSNRGHRCQKNFGGFSYCRLGPIA